MTAPRPRPTPIAAPRSRPARPGGGAAGASGPTTASSETTTGGRGGGSGGGGGTGRAPTIGIGPVSSGRSLPGRRSPHAAVGWTPPGGAAGTSTVPGSVGRGGRADGVVMGSGGPGSDLEQFGLLVLDRLVDVV